MKKLLLILLCLPIIGFGQTTTLLSEDFSGGLPSTWTAYNFGLCIDSFHIENSASFALDPVIQGNFMLASSYENGAACQASTDFRTNDVDCTPYDSVFLSFDIDFDPWTTGNDTISIYLWDGWNWNFVDEVDFAVAGGFTYNITQNILSTFTEIAFWYHGYDGNYCAIDNILIEGVNYGGGPLTVIGSANDISCNGLCDGAIDITVSGGIPPYSYVWSNGNTTEDLTGICSGPYSVTVLDSSGNNGSWSGSIYQPNLLTVTSTTTPTIGCTSNDGSINVIVSGGTPPYLYHVNGLVYTSGTLNNLSAGTYSIIIIDANGCSDSIMAIVQNVGGSGPTVSVSSTNISCFGENDGEIILGFQPLTTTTVFSEDFSSGSLAAWNGGSCNGFVIDNAANYSWWGNGMNGNMATSWSTDMTTGIACQALSNFILPYSGAINLSGYTNPVLEFYHEFDDLGFVNDTGYAMISPDAGNNWYLLDMYTSSTFGIESFNLSSYISSTVWIAFQHQGYNGGNWSIDNVNIIDSTGSTVNWTGPNGFSSSSDTISSLSAGNYTYSVTDHYGCITDDTITISEPQQITFIDSVTACDSYTWIDGNTYIQNNNTATYTLIDTAGCDSIATLDLILNASTSSYSNLTACNSYLWNGNTYTNSGIYIDTSSNQNGCPQIDTLDLTITNTGTYNSITNCDNYTWNGTPYFLSGTYTFNNGACTDTLYLTINNSSSGTTSVTACDSYTWEGQTLTTAGTLTYTYVNGNASGCDSVHTLNLTINYSNTGTSTVTACDSYTWEGQTVTQSDTLTHTYVNGNSSGCDSTHTLNLTINNSDTSYTNIPACDSVVWNVVTYDSSGTYTYNTSNSIGCDSIATLNLTINNSTSSTTTVIVCDSLVWYGVTYTTSGTYDTTFTNSVGCDSTATLHLTINYSNTSSQTLTVCDSYLWNGITYTTSGTYGTTLTNSSACDSVVTLNLTINNATTSTDVQTACDTYTWIDGNTYAASNNTATNTVAGSNGCDSVITLDLTITGNPIATITQAGLDLDASVVGGNTPFSYHWNTTETTQQITPTANGTYWVIVEDINQCISDTVYFNVTWISTDITELDIVDLSIYPNPSRDVFNITFTSNEKQDLEIRIINVIGENIFIESKQQFVGEYTKQIMLGKYPKAIYLLEIKTSEGIVNRKLMLQ